jgi:hypothetical protein
MLFPVARQDGLVVRELPDETLVYDLRANKAHCLNRAAALVWRLCDGRASLAKLAAALREELGVPDGEAAARLALQQLSRRGLLENPAEPESAEGRIGRREALRKLAVLGALPIVMTVAARHASAAQSLCDPKVECFFGGLNVNGTCVPTLASPPGTSCGNTAGMTCDGKGNCISPRQAKCPSGKCNSLADCPQGTIVCSGGNAAGGCIGECQGPV